MTDLRKAAEQALEALEEYTCVVQSGTDPNKWHEVVDGGAPARKAINALRQALAQPVMYIDGKRLAQGMPDWKPGMVFQRPKREWVGLTDEEIQDAMDYWSDDEHSDFGGAYQADSEYFNVRESWRYIEAKLKEKNA